MKVCQHCGKEVDEFNFSCPFCHSKLPRRNSPIKGHASLGDLDSYNQRVAISIEDKNMIRDKNHISDDDGDDDFDCAQPYSFITRENGDRD